MAGGLEIALCSDLIVADEGAIFSDAHSRYGLLPAFATGQGLSRTVGPFKAKEILFTSDRYTAHDMEQLGPVNKVAQDGVLHQEVSTLVDKLAACSSLSIRRMKQMVNDGMEMPWDVAVKQELQLTGFHSKSHDALEVMSAFAEKRPPRFRGY